MPAPTAPLREAVASVEVAWGDGADVSELADDALLAVNARIAEARRHVDALHARVAAEVASRSRAELGKDGLARRAGHRTPAKLIAGATGGHIGDAARLIQVGEATAPSVSLGGERVGPKHPHIAQAIAAGSLSVVAAAAIAAMLDKLPPHVHNDARLTAEESLTAHAAELTLDELQAVLHRADAVLDPEGLEPRIAALRAERSLRISQDREGMTVLTARLDPETAAPIVTAIQSIVTQQLRTSRGRNRPGDAPSAAVDAETTDRLDDSADAPLRRAETRSIPQLNADALAMIGRHITGCDQSRVPGSSTTVLVRMTLDQLRADTTGIATIDGIEQPIDAGTARRLAASAGIIPEVLGTHSETLDLGRIARAFSTAQRLVLGERDGGCAGCHLPPAFTEAHHLTLWSRGGSTDLDGGILLCTGCHHRVHEEGWEIRIEAPPGAPPHAGTVWFVPPARVDPTRTPRRGGRHRFDPLTWGLAS